MLTHSAFSSPWPTHSTYWCTWPLPPVTYWRTLLQQFPPSHPHHIFLFPLDPLPHLRGKKLTSLLSPPATTRFSIPLYSKMLEESVLLLVSDSPPPAQLSLSHSQNCPPPGDQWPRIAKPNGPSSVSIFLDPSTTWPLFLKTPPLDSRISHFSIYLTGHVSPLLFFSFLWPLNIVPVTRALPWARLSLHKLPSSSPPTSGLSMTPVWPWLAK